MRPGWAFRWSFALPGWTLLEHREHPVGHDEAADDVRRAEHDRQEPEDRAEGATDRAGHEHRADDHDPVDRVRAAHQWGVQSRRHLRNDFEADEDREDEDIGRDDRLGGHAGTLCGSRTFFVCSCTTSPSFVITVPLMTSSFMSRLSLPSFVIISPSRLWMLREYIWLAWYGIVDGMFVVPSMRTPSTSMTLP